MKLGAELVLMVADAVAGGIPGRLLKIRGDLARDTLLERVNSGDVTIETAAEQDEAAAIIIKYLSAAANGAALRNLKLLADVAAARLRSKPVSADGYIHTADMIASLLPEEVFFLGELAESARYPISDTLEKDLEGPRARLFHQKILGTHPALMSSDDIHLVGVALGRTGLVKQSRIIGGAMGFAPSRRLLELVKLADFLGARDVG